MATGLEYDDIPTLALHGYMKLRGASFHLLNLRGETRAVPEARRWLAAFAEQASWGKRQPGDRRTAMHIAFTQAGLARLGLAPDVLGGFSLPFRAGMHAASRRRILGDVGDDSAWSWGGDDSLPDAVLLVYAAGPDEEAAQAAAAAQARGWLATGEIAFTSIELSPPSFLPAPSGRTKEHFGFDDGIGNPVIAGERRGGNPDNEVAAGEIVLGYQNEMGNLDPGPHVSPGGSGGAVLPHGSFTRNGSYLVMRQLAQYPIRFWSSLAGLGQEGEDLTRLAAKLVGRWPNGAPLARAGDSAPHEQMADDDHFRYGSDPHGHGCPFGAHVRRMNPRDMIPLLAGDPENSIRTAKMRRILRRGRTYGAPNIDLANPASAARGDPADDDGERGLHFLCLCADIDRQFEFVHQSWGNSRKFAGLPNDADPILNNPEHPADMGPSGFTIQKPGVARKLGPLERFVEPRGGAYFFLPGKRALQYLAGLNVP